MWVADASLVLGWVLVAGWLAVAVGARLPGGDPGVRWPRPGRGVLLTGGAAALLVLAQGGVLDDVEDGDGLVAADGPVLGWMIGHRSGSLTTAARIVSDLGATGVMAVLVLLVAGWLAWHRRWVQSAVATLAIGGAAVLVSVVKHLMNRSRPPEVDRLVVETNQSLPSGHALVSVVALGLLVALALARRRGPAVRVSLVTSAAAAIGLIGASRLYLGVHWFTDVVTGWLLGGAWLLACLAVAAAVSAALARPPAPVPSGGRREHPQV